MSNYLTEFFQTIADHIDENGKDNNTYELRDKLRAVNKKYPDENHINELVCDALSEAESYQEYLEDSRCW